jgi:hypothetical protein
LEGIESNFKPTHYRAAPIDPVSMRALLAGPTTGSRGTTAANGARLGAGVVSATRLGRHHSGLMFAARITLSHFSISEVALAYAFAIKVAGAAHEFCSM